MADGIFTDDELKAQEATEQTALETPVETDEQKAERERDEQGRFKAKETAEETAEVVEEGKEKGNTVPQGALHAERERRKAAEVELTQLREQLGAIQKMREQVASRKPEDLPAADDPAAIEHLRKRLGEVEQQTTRVTQTMDQAALDQQELQQLGSFMGQSEAAFRQEKPDYDEAINHVVQARARELTRYGLNQAQIQETIREEATEIVRTAVARGLNPAQLGYEIAQDRGYVPKQAQQQEETAKPNGGGANAILDAIEQAKKANKSLGSGGGSSPKTLNAEAVLALSPEEFEQLYSTPEGRAMIDSL
jgi:hypothetical protein